MSRLCVAQIGVHAILLAVEMHSSTRQPLVYFIGTAMRTIEFVIPRQRVYQARPFSYLPLRHSSCESRLSLACGQSLDLWQCERGEALCEALRDPMHSVFGGLGGLGARYDAAPLETAYGCACVAVCTVAVGTLARFQEYGDRVAFAQSIVLMYVKERLRLTDAFVLSHCVIRVMNTLGSRKLLCRVLQRPQTSDNAACGRHAALDCDSVRALRYEYHYVPVPELLRAMLFASTRRMDFLVVNKVLHVLSQACPQWRTRHAWRPFSRRTLSDSQHSPPASGPKRSSLCSTREQRRWKTRGAGARCLTSRTDDAGSTTHSTTSATAEVATRSRQLATVCSRSNGVRSRVVSLTTVLTAFIACAGAPDPLPVAAAVQRVRDVSLAMLDVVLSYKTPRTKQRIEMRVGCHVGAVLGAVIGSSLVRAVRQCVRANDARIVRSRGTSCLEKRWTSFKAWSKMASRTLCTRQPRLCVHCSRAASNRLRCGMSARTDLRSLSVDLRSLSRCSQACLLSL